MSWREPGFLNPLTPNPSPSRGEGNQTTSGERNQTAGGVVVENGVKIIAPLNLPASVPFHASMLWSRNLTSFLLAFWKDKAFTLDLNDEILRGALITHQGEVTHAKTKELMK
ncbi:MAG: hypothetical protein QM703_13395 [Gemmatales bacterium]